MLDQVTNYLSNAVITEVSHIESDITLKLGDLKLWVQTAWRLEKDGRIVVGNDNLVELLYHDDYEYDYGVTKDLIKDSIINATIIDVSYTDFNELILSLSNGFKFRSFLSNGDEDNDADTFQLYKEKQRFIVCSKKVELENLHQFYKG